MKRYATIFILTVFTLLAIAGTVEMTAAGTAQGNGTDSARVHHTFRLSTARAQREMNFIGSQMASSTFPVVMTVKGNSLCVKSQYSQLLPIYTRGGTFYMAMRLNKGMNWLSGLPRGRYIINKHTISIP